MNIFILDSLAIGEDLDLSLFDANGNIKDFNLPASFFYLSYDHDLIFLLF